MNNTMYDDPKFCPWCGGVQLLISEDILYDDDCNEILVYHQGNYVKEWLVEVDCVICGEHFAIFKGGREW